MIPRRLALVAALLVLVTAGAWAWRVHARVGILHDSIPARPGLASFPPELTTRVVAAENRIRRGPDTLAALAELAQLYHANGFQPEAVTAYRGLAELDPANLRWPHRLAGLYADHGRLDDALLLWRRAPDHLPALIRTGDVLLKLNRPAEAATAYQAALRLDGAQPHALTGLARIDLAAGRWQPARDRLAQAARASGGRIGADLLATACERLGDNATAAEIRARAKSSGAFHDPPDPWIDGIFDDCYDVERLVIAAGFADHAGDVTTARRRIDRALALSPTHGSALFQSGNFALARRDYDRARADFLACVRAAPDFSDGWMRLISVHQTLGNTAAAAQTLKDALTHNPRSPALLLERATRLVAADRHAEAIVDFEAALRVRPLDADALVRVAPIYFRLDRVADGLAALQRALAAEPEHPSALITLALHGIGTGDEAAARLWLQRARQQDRVPRAMLDQLTQEFRQRFGRVP